MYLETHLDVFSKTSTQIVQLILDHYDDSLPFGFKCQASSPSSYSSILIDNAGLLDGVAGTILSLLFSLSNNQPGWLQIFSLN
jgi:hypothetical protein